MNPTATPRRDMFTAALALLLTVAFCAFIGALFVVEVPASNKDTLLAAAGILFAGASGSWGYYFGSSQGSKSKDELIAANTLSPPPK